MKSFFLFKKQILILFLLTLFSSNFFLIGPYISKLFIDKAVIGKDIGKFLALSVIGGSVFLFSILIKLIADITKNRIAVKLKLNLANKFIRKFYSLDLSFLQAKSTGENIYRFSDTDRIADFILEQLPSLLADIFKIPVMLGISLWISPRMTVLLFILSPLFLLHSLYIRNKLKLIYEGLWQRSALVSKELYQGFSKVFIIKAHGWEAYQRHKLVRSLLKNIRLKIKSFRWVALATVISSFLSKTIYGLVSLYGGWLIIKGKLTLGSYTAVMLYLVQLGGIFESLGYKFEYFSQEMVSLKKFFEIMDIQPLIKDRADAKDLVWFRGEIMFQDVCFRYGKGRELFKGLNFMIPACSWIGIAGPSGCGKTSLINLILRLYEPQQGEIFLDGLNLKGIRLISLREKISIATQQPFLFDLSIRENISYGLKNWTQDEIKHAAEASCIHDFIRELPCGYDTIIGEDGCYLSQGLKQRIAIARGILRKPRLLILDEATSSLDSPTEEKVFGNLKKLRDGLSTIIISHRLFSIKDCRRIYFLTDGSRVEEGTHAELLSNPAYRDFFDNQESAIA